MAENKYCNSNQDQQIKKMKRILEGWRMAVLPIQSILLWEQQWHPIAIFGSSSIFYLTLWLMDLNFLTAFAVIGLFINLMDFIVPIACNSLCNPNAWNGIKEKSFEDTCKSLVSGYNKIISNVCYFWSLRDNSPMLYYILSASILTVLAILSTTFNNTFLMYLVSTTFLMWPGLQKKGFFNNITPSFCKTPKIE